MDNLQTFENRNASVIANEINLIKEQTQKFLLSSAIEIGKRLKEAKEVVGHGNWTEWLEESVDYSQRTAQNLIKIFEEYGQKMMTDKAENSNSQALADLGYTQAIAMLKLDFEEREKFIEENDVNEMTTRELDKAIKEKNEVIKQKDALENKMKELVKQIEATESDQDEIDRLEKELSTAKSKLDKANAALSKKPKEITKQVEVEKVVEVESEEAKKRIKSLEDKLTQSEATVKYKAAFEVIMTMFNELIEALDAIKQVDANEYEKYRGATNKLLERLKQ